MPIDGKYERQLGVSCRTLSEKVKVTQLRDVVAPEFEANGLGHAKAVDIEDAAADAELRDVLHHSDALESDRFEVRGQGLWPTRVSFAQLEARGCQRTRQLRPLEQRTTGSHDDAQIAAADPLERLHSLAGYLGVGLGFAEAFTRRVECDVLRLDQGAQVCQPALGTGHVIVDDDEKPLRHVLSESGHDHGIRGSVQAAHGAPRGRTGKLVAQLSEFPEGLGNREQLGERHGAS